MGNKYVKNIEYTIYTIDKELKIIDIDEKFEMITGYNLSDIKNNNIYQKDLIPEEDRDIYFEEVRQNLERTGEAYIEHRIKRKDGKIIFVFCLGCNNYDSNGNLISATIRITRMDETLLLFFREKELKKSYKRKIENYKKKSNIDSLTKVFRRTPLILHTKHLLKNEIPFAMILIDIDDFKYINDNYGHMIGDEALIKVSQLFCKTVDDTDLVCRMGGDEFALILSDNNEVISIVEHLLKEARKIKISADENFQMSISVGIKFVNGDKLTFEEIYQLADSALYVSKENGKNQYSISE